jgi:aldose 1-epimerase
MSGSESMSAVKIFTLTNGRGLTMRVTDYGGIILSLLAPDRNGRPGNVVLSLPALEDYERDRFYIGALVGRYANRIAQARFVLDGVEHRLTANAGPHQLHGGRRGFNRVFWEVLDADGSHLTLRYVSPDGEEGFPGRLETRVTYRLTDSGALVVDYHATTDRPTHVTFTQHSYFDLTAGGDVLSQRLAIHAAAFTPVDEALIPTGEVAPVDGTRFDFRASRVIGSSDYDINYILAGEAAATLVDPRSGRRLDVRTTEPGLQLYTGNRGGVCLETQHYPDSPNHANFPTTILRPGATYRSQTVFAFGIEAGS